MSSKIIEVWYPAAAGTDQIDAQIVIIVNIFSPTTRLHTDKSTQQQIENYLQISFSQLVFSQSTRATAESERESAMLLAVLAGHGVVHVYM